MRGYCPGGRIRRKTAIEMFPSFERHNGARNPFLET
jgi:hypothetical protein